MRPQTQAPVCHRGRLGAGDPGYLPSRRPVTPKASAPTNTASPTEASCLSFGHHSASSSAPPSKTSGRKRSPRHDHDQHPGHSPSAATIGVLIASAAVSRNPQDRRSSCSYRVRNPSQPTCSTTGQRNAVTATMVRPHTGLFTRDGHRAADQRTARHDPRRSGARNRERPALHVVWLQRSQGAPPDRRERRITRRAVVNTLQIRGR